mgnify:CR=1 FL=1
MIVATSGPRWMNVETALIAALMAMKWRQQMDTVSSPAADTRRRHCWASPQTTMAPTAKTKPRLTETAT